MKTFLNSKVIGLIFLSIGLFHYLKATIVKAEINQLWKKFKG